MQWCVVRKPWKTLSFIVIVVGLLSLFSRAPQQGHHRYENDGKNDTIENAFTIVDSIVLGNDTEYRTCRGCFVRDYKMIQLPKGVCDILPGQRQTDLQVVMFILTKPADLDIRIRLRQTWLSSTKNNTDAHARHVFVLGRASGQDVQSQIDEEHLAYNDIVQQDFEESYNNLTLKTLLGIEWATRYCSRAQYIQKIDDDIFVHVPNILRVLSKIESNDVGLVGQCMYHPRPRRDWGVWKWRVSEKEYNGTIYPAYCNGPSYVLNMSVAQKIIRLSPNIPFFRVEDVYIGLCLKVAGDYKIRNFFYWMTPNLFTADANITRIDCVKISRLLTSPAADSKMVQMVWNKCFSPWWRHQMETFSVLLAICAGNSPVSGEFPTQRPVTRSFDTFFHMNKRLSKQSRGWWFETLSWPLWRHCNAMEESHKGKLNSQTHNL